MIIVDDVNDNVLKFEVFLYSKFILEDFYVGDIVFDVCVCDLDIGFNVEIWYSIINNGGVNSVFCID